MISVASGFSRPSTELGTALSRSKGRKATSGVQSLSDSRILPPTQPPLKLRRVRRSLGEGGKAEATPLQLAILASAPS